MKKHLGIILITVLFVLLTFPAIGNADTIKTIEKKDKNDSRITYSFYDAATHGHKSIRSSNLTPVFYIYNGQTTAELADELINELAMANVIEEWGAQVYIVNPLNNKSYTAEDSEAFLQLLSSTHGVPNGVSNVKLIGINEGGTFVNEELSDLMYPVAGVMTYGGEVKDQAMIKSSVPTYISNSPDSVIELYNEANGSKLTKENKYFEFYTHSKNELQQVVVAKKKESLATAFENAWKEVFSKNYRMHNKTTEFYMADVTKITSDYDLEPIINFEELGLDYHQMENKPLNGKGKFTWYEYVPKVKATKNSVPLIVTMHGFGNDPRIQGDTSGWVELAAKENFIVVSPEWQDKENNFAGTEGLEEEGVLNLVEVLKEKYPQIDPSRIYITGLSAGGSKAALWGAKHSDVFAAAAAISSPGVDKKELTEIAKDYQGGQAPFLYMCGDHDFFQMIPVDGSSPNGMPNIFFDDPNVSMFEFIQAYQKINKLQVTKKPNLDKDPYYGVELMDQKEERLGSKDILSGKLVNDEKQTLIELVTIKDLAHWNYRPEATYAWNFFKQYKRDMKDGSLEIVSDEEKLPSTNRKTTTLIISAVVVIVVIVGIIVLYRKNRNKATEK